MKRIVKLFLVVLLLVAVIGCGKKEETDDNVAGHLIIEYRLYSVGGTVEEYNNYQYVKVFSDKVVEWGYRNGENITKSVLDDKDYNSLVSVAFSKDFTSLKEDQSDPDAEEEDSSYITIYYEDGGSKRIGGMAPTNATYLKVEDKLIKIFNTDHE